MENPLEPAYSDDRLYGRGACDTKGSLAAMLYAVEECARNPEQLSADVVLCASVDEERAFKGILALRRLGRVRGRAPSSENRPTSG